MILGLIGLARSGKDTVAMFLQEDHGFHRFAFADPLKDAFATYHGIPRCWCDGLDEDGMSIDRESVEVFMEPLDTGLDIEDHITGAVRGVTIREGLQRFGQALREQFGPDFWVKQTAQRIAESNADKIVVTDVRYPNEIDYVRRLEGGKIVYITRPGLQRPNGHSSEDLAHSLLQDPLSLADLHVTNDGTLNDLRTQSTGLVS